MPNGGLGKESELFGHERLAFTASIYQICSCVNPEKVVGKDPEHR
jgi:hypothetical protein